MYLLSNSTTASEIGNTDIQVQKMSSDYMNYSVGSIQLINYDDKLTYVPLLNSFIVQYHAKLTDSLNFVTSSGCALLISEKLLKVLLSSNIENYQYFEADVIYRKKHFTYYFFFIYGQNYDLVDYKNMRFWGEGETPYSDFYREPHEKVGPQRKDIIVEKPEQIINWQSLYPDYARRCNERVKLNHANIYHDMIRLPLMLGGGYYISEKLRDAIMEQGCTGIKFTDEQLVR